MKSNIINDMRAECLNHSHTIKHKHIATVIKNGRPIIDYSYNTFNTLSNNDFNMFNTYSLHAEISAIINAFKLYGIYRLSFKPTKKLTKRLKKCSIVVLRIDMNGNLAESKPCKSCLNVLKQLNIKNVYYSSKNGIIKESVRGLESEHLSGYMRNIVRGA